jgi:hypothetical protein
MNFAMSAASGLWLSGYEQQTDCHFSNDIRTLAFSCADHVPLAGDS